MFPLKVVCTAQGVHENPTKTLFMYICLVVGNVFLHPANIKYFFIYIKKGSLHICTH